MLGSAMLMSLKRRLEPWCTRTMSADEQSEDVDLRLVLAGVRVIQHILLWGGGS